MLNYQCGNRLGAVMYHPNTNTFGVVHIKVGIKLDTKYLTLGEKLTAETRTK
jgi:hypothetical protein